MPLRPSKYQAPWRFQSANPREFTSLRPLRPSKYHAPRSAPGRGSRAPKRMGGGTLASAKKTKDRQSVGGFDNKWERHAKSDAKGIRNIVLQGAYRTQTPMNVRGLGP